ANPTAYGGGAVVGRRGAGLCPGTPRPRNRHRPRGAAPPRAPRPGSTGLCGRRRRAGVVAGEPSRIPPRTPGVSAARCRGARPAEPGPQPGRARRARGGRPRHARPGALVGPDLGGTLSHRPGARRPAPGGPGPEGVGGPGAARAGAAAAPRARPTPARGGDRRTPAGARLAGGAHPAARTGPRAAGGGTRAQGTGTGTDPKDPSAVALAPDPEAP